MREALYQFIHAHYIEVLAVLPMVLLLMPWPVAQLYSEKYLKQEDKDRIAAMVEEIREAYHGILGEADWLSEETHAKAVEKLDAIQKNVLYPDSSVMTPEISLQNLADSHPLNYLRINVVLQHFDEFLNLYDIHEGDGMYLAPEDRVNIW